MVNTVFALPRGDDGRVIVRKKRKPDQSPRTPREAFFARWAAYGLAERHVARLWVIEEARRAALAAEALRARQNGLPGNGVPHGR